MAIGRYTLTGAGLALVKPKLFRPGKGIESNNENDYIVGSIETDEPERTSFFGTPVYSNLQILPFSYDTLDGENIQISNGITIDTVIFTINQTKNIVKTPIQGRNGTVKEYISDGDFQIEISGAIVSPGRTYPQTEVNELIEILKAPIAIPSDSLISEYLNWFGIHSIVIESYDFPQTEGTRNQQEFRISAVSDIPVELEIDEF